MLDTMIEQIGRLHERVAELEAENTELKEHLYAAASADLDDLPCGATKFILMEKYSNYDQLAATHYSTPRSHSSATGKPQA